MTAGTTAFVLVVEQLHMFVWTMHRYMVGANGPLDFLSGPWRPPARPLLLIAASAGAVGVWGVALHRRTVSAGDAAHGLPSRSLARG